MGLGGSRSSRTIARSAFQPSLRSPRRAAWLAVWPWRPCAGHHRCPKTSQQFPCASAPPRASRAVSFFTRPSPIRWPNSRWPLRRAYATRPTSCRSIPLITPPPLPSSRRNRAAPEYSAAAHRPKLAALGSDRKSRHHKRWMMSPPRNRDLRHHGLRWCNLPNGRAARKRIPAWAT